MLSFFIFFVFNKVFKSVKFFLLFFQSFDLNFTKQTVSLCKLSARFQILEQMGVWAETPSFVVRDL